MILRFRQNGLGGLHKRCGQCVSFRHTGVPTPTGGCDVAPFDGRLEIAQPVPDLGPVTQQRLITPFPAVDLFSVCAAPFPLGSFTLGGDALFQVTALFIHPQQLIFEQLLMVGLVEVVAVEQ